MKDKISKHFSRHEFKCRCGKCHFEAVDIELVKVLEKLREYFRNKGGQDRRVRILSGWRCPERNRQVGGAKHSRHIRGIAADFQVYDAKTGEKVSPQEIYDYLNHMYPDKYGLGVYDVFNHLDMRQNRARWDNRR